MRNFRQFEVGPDPFGRKWQALFKWLQTAISIRHADTVDVKFLLSDKDGNETAKNSNRCEHYELPLLHHRTSQRNGW